MKTRAKKRIGAAAAALAVSATLATSAATPASAGDCAGGMCGGVTNNSYTGVPYAVGSPDTWTGTLYHGQKAGGWWSGVDVDGFAIPWNCWAGVSGWSYGNTSYAPVYSAWGGYNWYKVSTDQQVTINWVACS